MKRAVATGSAGFFLIAMIFAPGLPWSARLQKALIRLKAKTEAQVSRWMGKQPRSIVVTGKLTGYGAQVEALRGARVLAVESNSGYSAMCDSEGRFVIPHLTWFPGASYNLIVSTDEYHSRSIKLFAPSTCPPSRILDFSELRFDDGDEVERNGSLVRHMEYDRDNSAYYTDLFSRLTESKQSDEHAIAAICRFVSSKLNYREPAREFHSPRQILERGSCYCSNLALAMAALTAAGNYPTRTVHLSDSPEHKHTHVVVEVYYGDRWHLYDPTYGVFFLNRDGEVASYKELRLDPSLVTSDAFSSMKPQIAAEVLSWMPKTYQSGFHQMYEVSKTQICNGL